VGDSKLMALIRAHPELQAVIVTAVGGLPGGSAGKGRDAKMQHPVAIACNTCVRFWRAALGCCHHARMPDCARVGGVAGLATRY
jgi:hypothetical protein